MISLRGYPIKSSGLRFFSSSSSLRQPNYYELLELPGSASIKDVKMQFKKLLKKYHPDLNSHLSEDEKKVNSDKFVQIVSAYDTLKDIKKKKSYDQQLKGTSIPNHSFSRRNEWQNKYYGEAKYYSKSGPSGLNTKRHRVYHFNDQDNNSTFSGRHKNYGDRYDVPHFNYNEHLQRNLKFEQRIINRQLTDDDREKILKQLSKTGDISNVNEELVTKHLMRQIHHSYNRSNNQNTFAPQSSTLGTSAKNPYMYHGPQSEESDGVMLRSLVFAGGVGSLFLLYSTLHG
ncbi:DnaJ-domain-containing protein [Hyphopichia burtonii NRRL Y-1933]|uniref:DnaJ-domain-containing protein n=1 Tax=Hyphopichia burtonii NRRL Y-1933 TaxID=984485 RepID=A0A1E4RR70_9ASCO|nr:DnaJ-domain-containing protein [Hyphopichia burtonii NRRL Y-1933]ODV69738.1 DnaJ-domain-containing protein [Hyphopichia burtonii NRRL Y-1933]